MRERTCTYVNIVCRFKNSSYTTNQFNAPGQAHPSAMPLLEVLVDKLNEHFMRIILIVILMLFCFFVGLFLIWILLVKFTASEHPSLLVLPILMLYLMFVTIYFAASKMKKTNKADMFSIASEHSPKEMYSYKRNKI